MALAVTHPFVSLIADDPTAVALGEVAPSNWNAAHTITGTIDASQLALGATLAFVGGLLTTVAMTGDVTAAANSFVTTVAKIQGTVVSGTTGTTNVVFSNSPTLSGNVIINNNVSAITALGTLQIVALDSSTSRIALDSFGINSTINFRRSDGTNGAKTALAINSTIGMLSWRGWDGTAYSADQAAIRGVTASNWGGADHGTQINFLTTAVGSTTLTNTAVLDNVGNFTAKSILGMADVRRFGAIAGINCQPAVAAIVAAGYTSAFLPSGYFYQGGGGGGAFTEIPIDIVGEDHRTSIIKAVDRTNPGVPGFIYLNSQVEITNVGTQSYPGDMLATPAGVQKTLFTPWAHNDGDAQFSPVWYAAQHLIIIGAQITSPEGVISTDNPGYVVTQFSTGDSFYASTNGVIGGVCCRYVTNGNGDLGLIVQNAAAQPANPHFGVRIEEYGTNAGCSSFAIIRKTGSSTLLASISDDGPATAATNWINTIVGYQTAGAIRSTTQGTTAFAGDFDYINAGNAGGTFTGNFENFTIATVSKWRVSYTGDAVSVGSVYTGVATFMNRSTATWNNGAGAQAATLLNGPVAGNPTKWIPVDDNTVTRYIPAW